MRKAKKYRFGMSLMLTVSLLLSLLLPVSLHKNTANAESEAELSTEVKIQDFEQIDQWSGLTSENATIREGTQSGRWQIYNAEKGTFNKVVRTNEIPHDWSGQEALRLWVHSKKATNSKVHIILDSNSDTTTAADYLITSFTVDWEGWKELVIPYYLFTKANSPVGFSKIDRMTFHTSWYGETPDPETELIFDDFTIDKLQALDKLPIDGFEDVSKWTSLVADGNIVKDGRYSGKWASTHTKKVARSSAIPKDWSRFDSLQFWLYSEKATGSNIYLIAQSDDTTQTGLDYYLSSIKVDWTGWKKVEIPLKDFAPANKPLGWDQIQLLTFHSQWYAEPLPSPETVVYFDSLELVRETFKVPQGEIEKQAIPGMSLDYEVEITNDSMETDEFSVQIPEELKGIITVDKESGTLLPGKSAMVNFNLTIPNNGSVGEEKNMTIPISSRLQMDADFAVKLSYKVVDWKQSEHQHPNAFVGTDDVECARNRVQSVDWAKSYRDEIMEVADKWLSADVSVPREGGGHPTWYLCDDGSPLKYDPNEPYKHYCASEDKDYTGSTYDAAWRYYRHDELVEGIKSLATAYVLSDELAYAEKAKEILTGYADVYPNYQKQARGGQMYWQTLDEAVSMIDVSHAYDLIYESGVLSNHEKANIELNFLKPSAVAISEYDMGRSNWQAWHIAAIGMIGFVTGDKELMDFAIEGEHGFTYLMNESVLSDGFWWEGTIAYHMYALTPLNILAEGAKRWGFDLYANAKLKKMFDVPLSYAYPNLTVPVNNDGGQFGSTLIGPVSPKGFYEYESAYAHYKDTEYAWLLNQKYQTNKVKREGDFALFKGVDQIPATNNAQIKSRNFEGVGHAVLRSGEATDQNYVLMDYGEHGGSHGHPDKLHIDLFGKGHLLAPDFGTPSYGHPLYRSWYKQSISHNTVTVDGVSQKESEGKLSTFLDVANLKVMRAEAHQAYSGVQYDRTILLQDEYAVDWFHVSDPEKEHQYDWTLHGLGQFTTDLTLEDRPEKLGNKDGYELLKSAKSSFTDSTWEGSWAQEDAGLHLVSLPFGSREVALTEGPGPSNKPDQNTPIVIQRQNAKEAEFVTVLQPTSSETSKLSALRVGEHGIRVDLTKQSDHLYYHSEAEPGKLLIGKVSTDKNRPFDFTESVTSQVTNDVLNITIDTKEALQGLAMTYQAPGISKVMVNGVEVTPSYRSNDQVVIELQAFVLIDRLTGKPETGNLTFKHDGESRSLVVIGTKKNAVKLDLNGKTIKVSNKKNIVELEVNNYLRKGPNLLKWIVAGKPNERAQLIVK